MKKIMVLVICLCLLCPYVEVRADELNKCNEYQNITSEENESDTDEELYCEDETLEIEDSEENSLESYDEYVESEGNEEVILEEDNNSEEEYINDDGNLVDEYDEEDYLASNLAADSFVDQYEDNDTREKAYNYALTKPVNTSIRMEGSLYSLGMRMGGLYSAEDEDWFKAYYNAGSYLFVDLRNIGKKNINIALYEGDNTKAVWDSANIARFEGKPEKYRDYYVNKSGWYYVKIYTLGDLPQPNYYFYFGPKEQQVYSFDVQIQGITLSTSDSRDGSITNLRKYFPKECEGISLQLNNTCTNGARLETMSIELGGTTYTTSGNNARFGIRGQSLYVDCKIDGRLVKRERYSTGRWSPRATGTFTCTMAPYPGNE